MNDRQALAKARKLFGKKAHIERNDRALPRAEREKAALELKAHLATKPSEPSSDETTLGQIKEWRRDVFIPWRKRRDELATAAHAIPRKIGELDVLAGIFGALFVHGQGDNWEECFEEYAKSQAEAAARRATLLQQSKAHTN